MALRKKAERCTVSENGRYFQKTVRQGCNPSPALFNIYIDDLLRNWKHKVEAGIMLKRNLYLYTLLFADDQVIIQDSTMCICCTMCVLLFLL